MKAMKEKAFRFIDAHREEMLALWQEIVNMESGSQDKPGIDAVAVRFQQVFGRRGSCV